MRKRTVIISNICIAFVLVGLGIAVFTTDLSNVFLSVGAPVYNGARDGGKVSIMFILEDDAAMVPQITKKLSDNDAQATFFVGGKWASDNRNIIIDIAKQGDSFEFGNHAYNNGNLTKLSESAQSKEIQNCHSMIKAITLGTQLNLQNGNQAQAGIDMKLFSPPGEKFNKTTLKCAEKLGYKTVIWSRDARTRTVFDKATDRIQSGDIVLLAANAEALGALDGILAEYKSLGLSVVKISELLKVS